MATPLFFPGEPESYTHAGNFQRIEQVNVVERYFSFVTDGSVKIRGLSTLVMIGS